MHEFAITRSLINQVLNEARKLNAKRVLRIKLLIGETSSVVPECVQFYFDHIKKDPLLTHTELEFCRIPLRLRCPKCGREFSSPNDMCTCNAGAEISRGDELTIESIEIE
ncbi:MAG: hydrogenase maturation nickel metallochaperone HypA [candidate division WOR-3 bacterium]